MIKPRFVTGAILATMAFMDTMHAFQSTLPSKHSLSATLQRQRQCPDTLDHKKSPSTIPITTCTSPSSSSSQLEASLNSLTSIASSPIGAITVLAGIVWFHELGHYLTARYYNITVEEFAIGFGPKLFGFEAFGNEFNVRALPLGGYVRFPENYNITEAQAQEEAAREAFRKRREEENWTVWQDVVNILTFGNWDEQRKRRRQLEQAAKDAASPKSTFWERIINRQKKKQQPQVDPEKFEIAYYDDPNLLQNRNWIQRAVVLSGGVFMNMVLAYCLYFGQINWGSGIPEPVFDSGVIVSQAHQTGGASAGILRQGDVIIAVNGKKITMTKPTVMAAQQQVSDVIGAIRQTPKGDPLSLQVNRNNEAIDIVVTPQTSGSIQTIGVYLGPNFKEIQTLQSNNVMEAARLAYRYLSQVVSQTLDGILSLLGTLLMGKGPPPGQSVSGPIGLIKSGAEVVSTKDVTAIALFAAALSVNLGVINALPLPALDGGQLLFVLAEAVTGRKVDQRLQEGITGIAVLLLLVLSISTAFSDVGAILNGK